jgi:hypothetical protein
MFGPNVEKGEISELPHSHDSTVFTSPCMYATERSQQLKYNCMSHQHCRSWGWGWELAVAEVQTGQWQSRHVDGVRLLEQTTIT